MSDIRQVQERWTYKDSHRHYWTIDLYKTGESKPTNLGDDSDDLEWDYIISRENGVEFHGIIYGQYDDPPSVTDVLLDFTTYITAMAMGCAKYANPVISRGERIEIRHVG